MTKVYCSECRFYSAPSTHCEPEECAVPDPKSGNYYSRSAMTFQPSLQNASNDCIHWKHQRGLIEWFNDLLLKVYYELRTRTY